MAKPVPLSLVPAEKLAFVPTPADAAAVLEAAADRAKRGVRGAMATVVSRSGSAPATPGQKLYAAADRTCLGTVGGGAIEREVLGELERMTLGQGAHRMATFRLGPELGMCCGGSVEILLEPIESFTPCLVVGGGHVASALAPVLAKVGFSVTVV